MFGSGNPFELLLAFDDCSLAAGYTAVKFGMAVSAPVVGPAPLP